MNLVNGPEPLRWDDTTNYGPNRRDLGHASDGAQRAAQRPVGHRPDEIVVRGPEHVSATVIAHRIEETWTLARYQPARPCARLC